MGTDLQTTGQNQVQSTQWSPPEYSERLASLMAISPGSELPVLTDDEAAEAARALAVLESHPKGSSPRQINKMMTRLALAYPNLKLSTEEAAARLELYEQMLADIDVDLLSAAFAAAVKTLKFFPSVAELRDLAMSQTAPVRFQHRHRLRQLLDHHRQQPAPSGPPATPEQCQAIKQEFGLSNGASAMIDRIIGSQAA